MERHLEDSSGRLGPTSVLMRPSINPALGGSHEVLIREAEAPKIFAILEIDGSVKVL